MHENAHPLAGQTVVIKNHHRLEDAEYRIEDWWDRVYGGSWMFANGNPAALNYATDVATDRLPMDDEVVYGKVGGLGCLVHVSQLNIPDAQV